MNPSETVSASLRADARRNHELILAAARELMEERSYDVEMSEVAATAGVGIGTVYRRFPDKRALVRALLREKFELLVDRGNLLLLSDLGPWERLERFIRLNVIGGDEHEPAATALDFAAKEHADIAMSTEGLQDVFERLVGDAVEAGTTRPNLTWEDLVAVLCSAGHIKHRGDNFPGDPERLLEILLDGLRARA